MIAACAALSLPTAALAQSGEWEYSASIYGWFATLDTSVETPLGTVETELSFSDIWDDLNIGLTGALEARRGAWSFIGDLNYADLSSERATPLGAAFSRAEVDARLVVISGSAAYAVLDTPEARVDLTAGFRFHDIDLDTRLVATGAPADQTFSSSESWFDPVIGVRVRAPLSPDWFINAFADVGGFGLGNASDLSWQAYGGLGYRFNERWLMQVGYRHLSIEKDLGGRETNVDQSGLLVGATVEF
jgi:hypothetical protein